MAKLPRGKKKTEEPFEFPPDYMADLQNRWLSLLEAGYYLQLSKETLYRRIYAGEIPYHRVGRVYRFRTKELDEWMRGEKR